MTQSSSPPPPPKGRIADLISAILGYIDKPWKAVVVIILMVIGGFGYVAYEERARIFEVWLDHAIPELKVAQIPTALDKLIYETNADLVSIWSVDLPSNSQLFINARQREGLYVAVYPHSLPVFTTTSDLRTLLDVIEGHSSCVGLAENGSPIVRRLITRGMVYACAIPIPANPEKLFGVIYLSWKTKPDSSSENVAVSNARRIGATLLK